MNQLIQHIESGSFYIPFDKLTPQDYEDAIINSIKLHDKEIEDIITNVDEPNFQNTIEALEYSGDYLNRSTSIFFNLLSADTSDELDKIAEKISPLLTEHSNNISHNTKLFIKVKSVYDYYKHNITAFERLNTEQQTLLQNTYDDFVRRGANLDEADKIDFAKTTKELSLLSLQFSQDYLKELNKYELNIINISDITGLPESTLDIAKDEAKQRGLEGWVFTLHSPSYIPFLTYCKNRELRKEIYLAYNTLCSHDNEYNNKKIVRDIVNKKMHIAQLLGYSSYAEYVLLKRMAKNESYVNQLFDDLINAYMPFARNEVLEVENLARALEGDSFILMPWDFQYYSNILKEKRYHVNTETLRPYLELENVKKGVFGLAEQLYDLKFMKNDNIPVFNKDVEAFDVYDKNGEYVALLYCDFFPRSSKKSGAWMTSYEEQYIKKDGTRVYPQVSITTNFSKPTNTSPSLLTISELETFLHEFGHALHGMLSNVTYKSLSGTNVFWDFVELPSQFMENYCYEKDFLNSFAHHYQTGNPIPSDILSNIISSKNFNAAYSCIRQVSFGLLDMNLYSRNKEFDDDVIMNEKQVFDKVRLLPDVDETCMTVQFSHIMSGGYSAGYYSYKWAEILDADAFSLFKEKGIFNKAIANNFKYNILSRGGSEHPMILYERFRGRKPSIEALLKRNGLLKKKS